MLLLHGLGATKSSFFDTAAALSRRYTRPRDRPARLRRLLQALDGALRRAVRRPRRDRHDGRAGHRARPPRRQLDGRPGGDRGRPRAPRPRRRHRAAEPRRGLRQARLALARALRPARARRCCRTRSAASAIERTFWTLFADRDLVDPSVGRHRRRRVRAHLPLPRRPARVPRSARAIYLESPFGAAASTRGSPTLQPPALFVWASHDRLIPERFRHHVERWLPSAEQRRARGLRPRAAGRAPEAHERPAGAVLRACRPARRNTPASGMNAVRRRGHDDRDGDPEPAAGAPATGRRARAIPAAPRRPRRARSRLHPRDAPAPVAALAASTSAARCAGSATCPRTARCCSSATTPAAT